MGTFSNGVMKSTMCSMLQMLSSVTTGNFRHALARRPTYSIVLPRWPDHSIRIGLAPRVQGQFRIVPDATASGKHSLVFLGTPQVACIVLQDLFDAAKKPDSKFEVKAVVSQPARPKGRGQSKTVTSSPVALLAEKNGLSGERLLCPESARDQHFLTALRNLEPDLCVTAAYGNFLPGKFLDIPKFGTLNVHPSLLPKYRGAAPVNRALQDGVTTTGVSVAFTILKVDAGPILARKEVEVADDVQAPELLDVLFTMGAKLLVSCLDSVWNGTAQQSAIAQDEALSTLAPKMSREESILDFREHASVLHNKVRAFAPWPGTRAEFVAEDPTKGKTTMLELKILRTQVASDEECKTLPMKLDLFFAQDVLYIRCGGNSILKILEVQKPNSRQMSAADFKNGLGPRTLSLVLREERVVSAR